MSIEQDRGRASEHTDAGRRTHVTNLLQRKPLRKIATAAVGAVMAGIFSLGAAAPASADGVEIQARPTGCTYQVPGSWGAVAQCSSHNGGSYRASVVCEFPDGRLGVYDGPWRQESWSRAYCQGNSKAISAGIETSVSNNT
jgi:hypothetical protein